MSPEPSTPPTRRWYRLHWVTWLFVIVEIGALGCCQFSWQLGKFFETRHFGWPLCHIQELAHGLFVSSSLPTPYEYTCVIPSLFYDTLFWLLFVTSISFVVESRLRSSKRLQFSLLGMLSFTTTIAVLLTLVLRRWEVYQGLWSVGFEPSYALEPFKCYWPITAIILFGLGCTIYTLGSLASFAVRRFWSWTRPAANENKKSPP